MNETENTINTIIPATTGKRVASVMTAIFSSLVSIVLLFVILFGSGNSSINSGSANANLELMQRFNVFVSNSISTAMEGILELDVIYVLSDSDQVAPEPNQNCFGSTKDPEVLQRVVDRARIQLDGQELLFDPNAKFFEFSEVTYYLDETIFAISWKQVIDNVVYTFSEVKIEHPSQFRRFLADGKYGSEKQYLTSQMAASVNAVVAASGDFYKYRPHGIVVYNRNIERMENSLLDTCFIDGKGDLLFSRAGEITTEEQLQQYIDEHDVRFSLCFGPVLIENGEIYSGWDYLVGEITGNYARAAIAQLGELHYVVVCANNEAYYGNFPTLFTFASALSRLGIEKAYTLDGGQTATIVMNDKVFNRVSYGAERNISDIIYFATAIPDSK